MNLEVKIPPMGESISSGILAKWRVKDGDVVDAGAVLFELETDKITSEGTAEAAGKISFKAQAGDEVQIGQVVAVIDTAVKPAAEASAPASNAAATSTKADLPPSPAVRRIAEESGIAPSSVAGTGKDGRVTKGDMLGANPARPAAPATHVAAVTPSAPKSSPEGKTSRRKLTPLRKRIAERLVASQHETASLTTFNEVDMSAIMALRSKHQEAFVAKYGSKLGFMSFFVKAVVHALKEVPSINAQLDGDELIENHYFDIGVAVGTERGLVVPVVRDCDALGFADIEKSIAGYAKKARDGKISMDDLQGGVFTITNGGTYGSLLSTPIINSPQSAILGMHSIQERAVVVDGQVVVRPMMYVALTYDHQVVDGKEAVTFLVKVKQAIEDPTRLLFSI